MSFTRNVVHKHITNGTTVAAVGIDTEITENEMKGFHAFQIPCCGMNVRMPRRMLISLMGYNKKPNECVNRISSVFCFSHLCLGYHFH